MAIYHLNVRAGSRQKGHSAQAKAQYVLREGRYKKELGELTYSASGNMPAWAQSDAVKYWKSADIYERKNATLYREIEFALPRELARDHRHELAHDFAKKVCDDLGMPYVLAVHEDRDGRNPHCHLVISEKMNDGHDRTPELWFKRAANKDRDPASGGARKAVLGQSRAWLQTTREQWQDMANKALEMAGVEQRIDHRTLEAQGIDRVPQIHIGPHIGAMEARGIQTDRADIALRIHTLNAQIRAQRVQEQEYGHNQQNLSSTQHRADSKRNRATHDLSSEDYRRLQNSSAGSDREIKRIGDRGNKGAKDHEQTMAGTDRASGRTEPRLEVFNGKTGRKDQASSWQNGDFGHDHGIVDGFDHGGSVRRITDLAGTDMSRTWDKTRTAVAKQIKGMGCDNYIVGIRGGKKDGMLTKNWTAQEVLDNVQWLKKENAMGADIYIKPDRKDQQGIVLVDDLNSRNLERMKADGLEPAVITQTSPNNYQAWVRISDSRTSEKERTAVAKHVAQKYEADPNSADFDHFGRLAGFTNRKPEHMRGTSFPFVKLESYRGKEATKAQELRNETKEAEAERIDHNVWHDIQQTQMPKRRKLDDIGRWYSSQWYMLQNKYGQAFDASRADWYLVTKMNEQGYDLRDIAHVVRENSLAIDERKAGHIDDYVERTVANNKAYLDYGNKGMDSKEIGKNISELSEPYKQQIREAQQAGQQNALRLAQLELQRQREQEQERSRYRSYDYDL